MLHAVRLSTSSTFFRTMMSRPLPLTTTDILQECPKFRILLVGKSGVGKSSLINHAFNVDIATVSHQEHGIWDVEVPIEPPENPRFVLHDSQGFEPGETANLEKVKTFVQSRSGQDVPLRDRVHVVWLCITVPFAGGRVFETGDEEFLNFVLAKGLPVVVVFTKFDKLISVIERELNNEEELSGKEFSEEDFENAREAKADTMFENLCVAPLRDINRSLCFVKTSKECRSTLTTLVNRTQDLVEGEVWFTSAMAQRVSAQAKIDSSIKVGMRKYWQGLASSISFSDSNLDRCLSTIHDDITSTWNFNDPDNLLDHRDFRDRIKAFAQLVTPEVADVDSWFKGIDGIQAIIGLGSVFTSAVAPAIAAIGLSVMFVNWVKKVYSRTPDVLRCLMGYIVNLTLVMDQLFLDTLAFKPPRRLTLDAVDMALASYEKTEMPKVHHEIRKYANQTTFAAILRENNAQDKVISLIKSHRAAVV